MVKPSFVAVIAVIAFAGCGDDGDSAMSTGAYRDAAGQICRDAKKATAGISDTTSSNQAYVRQLRKLIAVNAKSRGDLEGLDPPEQLREAHRALLTSNDEGVALTENIILRLEKGEKRASVFRDVGKRIAEIGLARDAAARRLGVKECGNSEA